MTLEDRIARLEEAVARLSEDPAPDAPTRGAFWGLDALETRYPAGAVSFSGHLPAPPGPVRWQTDRTTASLLADGWGDLASSLDALAHPVRLRLLQLVLHGHASTADLLEAADLGTTGQLHHHLRQLVAAGWLTQTGRGQYAVPAARMVPLLTIVAALQS